jgi:hypothetical protein
MEALEVMGETPQLAGAYKKNIAGAVSHLRVQAPASATRKEERLKERREAAGIETKAELTEQQRKKQRIEESRARREEHLRNLRNKAYKQTLARARRAEAEAEEGGGHIPEHQVSVASWTMDAKVSVGQNNVASGWTEPKGKDGEEEEENKPLVDVMID